MLSPEQISAGKGKLADDLLVGAGAIADELGITPRQVYHLVKKKSLPIGHLGGMLIALRSELREAILKAVK